MCIRDSLLPPRRRVELPRRDGARWRGGMARARVGMFQFAGPVRNDMRRPARAMRRAHGGSGDGYGQFEPPDPRGPP
eukprot:13104487-Alexandrium_andersonii.AAC.1